jgi:mannose-6-phosphate isomerase class I
MNADPPKEKSAAALNQNEASHLFIRLHTFFLVYRLHPFQMLHQFRTLHPFRTLHLFRTLHQLQQSVKLRKLLTTLSTYDYNFSTSYNYYGDQH